MKRRPEWIGTRIVEMETLDGLRWFDYEPAKKRLEADVVSKRSDKTDTRSMERNSNAD